MTRNHLTSAAVVTVVALALIGFLASKYKIGPFQVAGVTKPVRMFNHCTLTDDPVTISVNDQVNWFAGDQGYTIMFPVSPFAKITSNTDYPILQGQSLTSGPVIPGVQIKSYKYDVTGADKCFLDPVVIVQK